MISALRQKRFFAQKTIYAVGQLTGIDPARISLIERGYKVPREDEKQKLAEVLECSVEEIFPSEQATGEEL